MNILIDIGHPAHVHFFRHAISIWKNKGYSLLITARNKEVVIDLLKNYGFDFVIISKIYNKKAGLIFEFLIHQFRLFRIASKFKPDIMLSIGGLLTVHAAKILAIPTIVFHDTEHAKLSNMLTFPFTDIICTPSCYLDDIGKKQIRYDGYHELAYLHPNHFNADIGVVNSLGINPEEKYCIIRFVSWQAHHDIGQHGIYNKQKVNFVNKIAKYAKPYISSETPLPNELETYRLNIPVHQIHHVMAFAALYIGEGSTMASESATLGVPAVYINTLKSGLIDMHEKYGLVRQTSDTQEGLQQSLDWLKDPEAKEKCRAAREELLAEKIDVTYYIVDTIEQVVMNYQNKKIPSSI